MAANSVELAPIIVKTNAELDRQLAAWKSENQLIGFVPTMGALHAGHLHLINSVNAYCRRSVCSIFVNPTQFNDKADFDRYPRTLDSDVAKLRNSSCDLVYAPSVEEVYVPGKEITKEFAFGPIAEVMEGKHRPGHFNGVGTVVKRLFELVKPDYALFGLKDYQQFCIINKLVELHHIPVKIIGVETVRETDGLAMSSRNALLDPLHRELAPVIYQSLLEAREKSTNLPVNNLKLLVEQRLLALPDVKLDYVEIADADTLQPLNELGGKKARIFVAAFFGKIRLIDNVALN
ncbi:MAG TPA: pantoate--beta-alanine ligase [Flavobacteriales bacterium]|nr:pantoate--beta-alanine ligase [Flavobacteriales bacterium]